MWRTLVPVLLIAGCAQLPPSPADLQAKKFETVPGKSVLYVVRTPMDSLETSGLVIDDRVLITTYRGTYHRLELEPGTHHLAGFGSASESLTLTTQPGRVYFLEHTVLGDRDDGGVIGTGLREVKEDTGRTIVMRSQLVM